MTETSSAKHHLKVLQEYKEIINDVGESMQVDPALIAGVISKEYDLNGGFNNQSGGYGLMRINKRYKPFKHGWFSREHIQQGVEILLCCICEVTKSHPKWSQYNQLRGGIAAYNFGVQNVQSVEGIDVGTDGGNYSQDVLLRAEYFKKKGYVLKDPF